MPNQQSPAIKKPQQQFAAATSLLAPNGKPSNLTPSQYRLVRTPQFKAWFGDWENEPATASKVVDENGEPLVCYHGTRNRFYIFDRNKSGESNTLAKVGFWFTPKKVFAENFAESSWWGKNDSFAYAIFLNIKNPKIYNTEDNVNISWGDSYEKFRTDIYKVAGKSASDANIFGTGMALKNANETIDRYRELLNDEGYDGIFINKTRFDRHNAGGLNNQIVAFYPNQIKLADGSNTTFDASNNDIRFAAGGIAALLAPNGKPSNLTPSQYRLVRTPQFKAWFGDWENEPAKASKVVDKNGEPLVVYHASQNAFTEFRVGTELGAHFGNIKQANHIARRKRGAKYHFRDQSMESGENVYACFLKINNPVRLIDIGNFENVFTVLENLYVQKVISEIEYNSWVQNESGKSRDSQRIQKLILSKGFDGVVYKNKHEGTTGGFRRLSSGDSWIVFSPNQIKSAINNTTFDAGNNDIRFAAGGIVNTENFKEWFKNSQVIDRRGQPLIVYHGSPDLRALKADNIFKTTDEALFGKSGGNNAYFFTDSYAVAKSYADPHRAFDYQNAEEGIMQFYLSLQNPLRINAAGAIWRKFETEIDGVKITGTRNLVNYAHQKGFDSLIVYNVIDFQSGNDKKTKTSTVYTAFYPNQIKLADGTNTTFNAYSNDIRFAAGGAVRKVPKDFDTDFDFTWGEKMGDEIIVAHSTSSNLLPIIQKEGLKINQVAVWENTTPGKIYFEIEPTRTWHSENVYGWKAVQMNGGVNVTLYVKVKKAQLFTDKDDSKLGARYRKNQKEYYSNVPPKDILGARFLMIDIKPEDFTEFAKIFDDNNSFAAGGAINNNTMAKNKIVTEQQLENSPAGGALIGKKREGQAIIHNKGTMGGYLTGKLHKNGGIKATVAGGGQNIEMQGGEVVITAPAVDDKTKREFMGKMLTNRQILSKINEMGGGVSFADGGEIPDNIPTTGKKYTYQGKLVPDTEIVKGCGCKHSMESGGIVQTGNYHFNNDFGSFTSVKIMQVDEKLKPSDKFFTVEVIVRRKEGERTIISPKPLRTMPINEFPKYFADLQQRGAKKMADGGDVNGDYAKERLKHYANATIGAKSLEYKRNEEAEGNGATFEFKTVVIKGVPYNFIKRYAQGWGGKRGHDYQITDGFGHDVSGFYNKVKKQNIGIAFNVKNLKELIYKFKTLAEDDNYVIRDGFYNEKFNNNMAAGGKIMIPTPMVEEIKESVALGYNVVKVGMITPKKRGVALCNDIYQVRGTYPLEMKDAIEQIIQEEEENSTHEKVIEAFSKNQDVYGDPLHKWHNISFEGDEDIFAYATRNGNVIYGLTLDKEKKKYSASLTYSPFYLETAQDEIFYFDTLKQAENKASELIKKITKGKMSSGGNIQDGYNPNIKMYRFVFFKKIEGKYSSTAYTSELGAENQIQAKAKLRSKYKVPIHIVSCVEWMANGGEIKDIKVLVAAAEKAFVAEDDRLQALPETEESGNPFTICTTGAYWVKNNYFPAAKVMGYSTDKNPTALIGSEIFGHDFLVLNGRYIIDFWYKHINWQRDAPVLLDMQKDKDVVAKYYGDPQTWEELPAENGYANGGIIEARKYLFDKDAGGSITINNEIDRVQILFNKIPSYAMRSSLKGSGWHWSPSNKAWQRKITPQAIDSARRITEAYENKSTSSEPKNDEKEPNVLIKRNAYYLLKNAINGEKPGTQVQVVYDFYEGDDKVKVRVVNDAYVKKRMDVKPEDIGFSFSYENKSTSIEPLFDENGATAHGKKLYKEALIKYKADSLQDMNKIRSLVFGNDQFYNTKLADSLKPIVNDYFYNQRLKNDNNSDTAIKPLKLSDIPALVKTFMPSAQQKAIVGSEEHWEVIERLEKIIREMPKTYGTEKIPENDKVCWLHYFYGGTDWYIIEKDMYADQKQAFGWVILNGDYEMAELGYISIEELKTIKSSKPPYNGVELDFYFTPVKLGEIKKKFGGEDKEEAKGEIEKPARKFKIGDKVMLKPFALKKEPVMQRFNEATVKFISSYYRPETGYMLDCVLSQDLSPRWFYENELELIVPISGEKIQPAKICLDGSIFPKNYDEANRILKSMIGKKSNCAYDITFTDGEVLQGSIDLEPNDFWDGNDNPFTWHINTFWPNMAEQGFKYEFVPAADIEFAKKIVSGRYNLGNPNKTGNSYENKTKIIEPISGEKKPEIETFGTLAGTVSAQTMADAWIPNMPVKPGGYTPDEINDWRVKHAHEPLPYGNETKLNEPIFGEKEKSRRELMDTITPLDLEVPFKERGVERFMRRFIIPADKINDARELMDWGIKERITDLPNGGFDVILSYHPAVQKSVQQAYEKITGIKTISGKKPVSIVSEEIIYPNSQNEDELDIDDNFDAAKGRQLMFCWAQNKARIMKMFDIVRADIAGENANLHLTWKDGSGILSLSHGARPESYNPSVYNKLVEVQQYLLNLAEKYVYQLTAEQQKALFKLKLDANSYVLVPNEYFNKYLKELEEKTIIYHTSNPKDFYNVEVRLNDNAKHFIKGYPFDVENQFMGTLAVLTENPQEVLKFDKFKGLSYQYKNPYELNRAIEEYVDKVPANEMTDEGKQFLSYYSGYGSLEKFDNTLGKEIKYQFFTPSDIAQRMWGLAYKYGYKGGKVLEPAVGIGEFIKYAPSPGICTAYEIHGYTAKICSILFPSLMLHVKSFETLFIKNNKSIKGNLQGLPKYDLLIGNPPYGDYEGLLAGMGEKSYTKAENWIDYFIFRGLDLLNEGGLLIYIIGCEVANGGHPWLQKSMTKCKQAIADKADLLDAYRLPNGVFERTDVLTDIIVLRKK